MPVQHTSRQLEITISETLYQWLFREAQRRAQNISNVVQAVLEQYVQQFDLTRTRTWELCGTFTVAEPEPEYLVGLDETGPPITNYAEHVDAVLYRGV
jgi:metal-responsive CopG/Arc/MetJ family transcriptional regulator